MSERLNRLLPDLASVVARFPIAILASVALCLDLNLEEGFGSGLPDEKVIYGGAASFLAAGVMHLFAESRDWARPLNLALALLAGLIGAGLSIITGVFETAPLFLFSGLVLVLMIAAYLRPNAEQGALWLFNLRLGLAALLAVIVGVAVAGGLSAIVEALNFLFEAGLPNNLHEHIWETAASLVAPIYGLALMPKDLGEEVRLADPQDSLLERGVSVLVNYVLAPIVVVYALILHAYAVKIVLQWSLPKGQIGTMVSIFALGGTGAWLIAWPWRDKGTWLLRRFIRSWFSITIVPAILLVIAVWRRIADYGVTPERYGLVLIALWLVLIAGYLAYRRAHADMRAILGGFAVLLLVGSAGPWGANGLTINSQFARLSALLEANGILKDGKLAQAPRKVDDVAKSSGNSMLYALQNADGLERLRVWFEAQPSDPFATGETDWALTTKLSEALGLNYTVPAETVSFTGLAPADIAISGSNLRVIGPLRMFSYTAAPATPPPASLTVAGPELVITIGTRHWSYSLAAFLQQAKAAQALAPNSPKALAIDIAPEMTIVVDSAYGVLSEPPQLTSGVFWLVIKDPLP